MKKLVGILVSVSMIFSAGVPAFAAEETEPAATLAEEMEPAAASAEEAESTGDEDPIHYIDGLSLDLSYDDRYDLSNLDESISPDEEYVIFQTVYEEGQGITSYKVSQGTKTDEADEALLTLNKTAESDEIDTEGNTEAIATGVGSGTVWLVRADQEEELREALEKDTEPGPENPDGENPDDENPDGENPDEENPDGGNPDDGNPDDGNPDDGNPDGGNPGETIDVYEIAVTVEPAALTLMFLAGQSNMEGYCDSYTGYTPDASIACEEGSVYSTYAPWGASKGKEITGIDFNEVCSTDNYRTTAGDFVAGSLQGAVTDDGTVGDSSNMSGGVLEYPLYSLTSEGGGKTGPDSGLAYEWNKDTGDKVWAVNTAYGATDIAQWIPGGNCYDRSAAIWENVLQTYEAELLAGHYTAGEKLVFWQQGETGDATGLTPAEYEESFDTMYNAMSEALGMDAFGFFMVRAGYATNRGADYRNEKDLQMSGPRIAQYWLGSGNSSYDNVFVASNANEQWVSDSGVMSYFESRYGSEFSYPTQSGDTSLPTTVNEVHYDIHYSQIGHNENGITAAYGMLAALTGSDTVNSVSWRDGSGQTVSSLILELSTDTAIAIPVAEPVYTAKQLTWDSMAGSVITYDAVSGVVQATNELAIGTEDLVASAGSETVTLPVTVYTSVDLRDIAGNYTGLYLYKGVWWYLKNGIIQIDYEGVEKNENGWWYVKDGRIDYSYTGFAQNSNGWWYVENGEVTFEKNSVIKDTNGVIGETGDWYYVVGSEVQMDFTGLADYANENGWWYIKNGKVDFTVNTVAKNKNGWWYVADGKVDFSYNGFAENENGWWYIEDGKVTFEKNGVLEDTTGAIGEPGVLYYVVGSKVQFDYTGVTNNGNENGLWYIRDGVVDFSYTGFAKNDTGAWYVEDGKVTREKNDIIEDTTGTIGKSGIRYYVLNSEVQSDYTGVADYISGGVWWYIKNGQVDITANTVAKNKNGWWYVADGKVDFTYNGFGENSNGKWYLEDGKVTFDKNSVLKDTTGALGTKGTWYYVVESKVQTSYTGVANYRNENGWWYIRDGKVDFSANTVAKNKNGWWYVLGGKVQFDFTGLANYKNENGWWYIQDGKVDFSANTVAKNWNGWWYVLDGKVQFDFTGLADYRNAYGWWYIRDGKVDFSYNGYAENKNGWWYVIDGKVDFSY